MASKSDICSAELNVTGHKCPVPVLRVRRCLERMMKGAILKVLATDPMTQIDIPHFCQQSGHDLMEMSQKDDVFVFLIKKAGE
ncbi:MAG: hypothetical protein COB54_04315 [Alphaproteobacteria bacterium]|nr:MAG: hypothetical protein COB54_04315 [Alphaproteobacteria bacterium]